jgi:hypothetical protein
LPFNKFTLFLIDTFDLQTSYFIQGIGEMAENMKFVENNQGLRDMVKNGFSERFPHVHHDDFDRPTPFGADFSEKLVEVLLAPTFATHPDGPRMVQVGNGDPVAMAFAHGNLINAYGAKIVRDGILFDQALHVAFIHPLDLCPSQTMDFGYALDGHVPTLATDFILKTLSKPATGSKPGQGLLLHGPAPPAEDPAVLKLDINPCAGTG